MKKKLNNRRNSIIHRMLTKRLEDNRDSALWSEYINQNPLVRRQKLVAKIPMSRDYIDELNQLWELMVFESGVCWLFKGIILREK